MEKEKLKKEFINWCDEPMSASGNDREEMFEKIWQAQRKEIIGEIEGRIQKIDDRLQGVEPTEGELGVIQGYKNVINLINGKL